MKEKQKVLHLLSQRPLLTGSGITLDALVRHAGEAGWEQAVVAGVPAKDSTPDVGGLDPSRFHPLVFGEGDLGFPVPGMSDVMPYRSTRFSAMSSGQVAAYRSAWRRRLSDVIAAFDPQVVHTHHIWIMSSLIKEIAPRLPVIAHCHATGFRQMSLCSELAEGVRQGNARNDRFVVLHSGHAEELSRTLGVPADRIDVVGAGYRDEIFFSQGGDEKRRGKILYIGKFSAAKGVPWLLDAFERLAAEQPGVELHVAGGGAGEEAEALRSRMKSLAPAVVLHGQISQEELAKVMRSAAVCVLPSFYEGIPLVLVEALACGCRLVATRLPGVKSELAPHLGAAMELVPLPRLEGVDRPLAEDLPAFVNDLTDSLRNALAQPLMGDPVRSTPDLLKPFTWASVFRRVEAVWKELLDPGARFQKKDT